MREWWQRLDLDARDAHAYGGILLITIGAWAIYWPAALITSGAILLYLAFRRAD